MNSKIISPYEKTQLAKHGISSKEFEGTSEPIEYITGHADFCGLDFRVNKSVLIPRVETEALVELSLQAITEKASKSKTLTFLEIGVGSGAIILSVAKHLEDSPLAITLTGTDISSAALSVAQQNESRLLKKQIVTWNKSNVLTEYSGKKIEILVANLPYIPSDRLDKLDKSVKEFEPILALDGGNNGFELIAQLLDQANEHLADSAIILLEVDSIHTPDFFEKWQRQFSVTPFTDCFDHHRFIRLDLLPPAQ